MRKRKAMTGEKSRKTNETSEQKVLFRGLGLNLGELEMRNSNYNHYRKILFVMNKLKVLALLFEKITVKEKFNERILLYGKSIKKFKKSNS